jgi:hypothetical protein
MNVNDAISLSKFHCNQAVTTPLGAGMVLAPFAVVSETGEVVTKGVAVRLPVDDVTSKALKKSNCLTPTAKLSGLWVFQEGEIS